MAGTVIVPTVGRVMWYYPGTEEAYNDAAPLAAMVAHVFDEPGGGHIANLLVVDPLGGTFAAQDVPVVQQNDAFDPSRAHVAWMPYQIGQAAAAATAPSVAAPAPAPAAGA